MLYPTMGPLHPIGWTIAPRNASNTPSPTIPTIIPWTSSHVSGERAANCKRPPNARAYFDIITISTRFTTFKLAFRILWPSTTITGHTVHSELVDSERLRCRALFSDETKSQTTTHRNQPTAIEIPSHVTKPPTRRRLLTMTIRKTNDDNKMLIFRHGPVTKNK